MGNCHYSDNEITEVAKHTVVKRKVQYKECPLGHSLNEQPWEPRVLLLRRGKLCSFKNKLRLQELVIKHSITSFCTEADSLLLNFVDADQPKLAVIQLENPRDVKYLAEAIARLKRPVWTDTSACEVCCRQFTFFRRKHHCRKCGCAVCGHCSRTREAIPSLGYGKPQRLCFTCSRAAAATPRVSADGPPTPRFCQEPYVTFAPVQVESSNCWGK